MDSPVIISKYDKKKKKNNFKLIQKELKELNKIKYPSPELFKKESFLSNTGTEVLDIKNSIIKFEKSYQNELNLRIRTAINLQNIVNDKYSKTLDKASKVLNETNSNVSQCEQVIDQIATLKKSFSNVFIRNNGKKAFPIDDISVMSENINALLLDITSKMVNIEQLIPKKERLNNINSKNKTRYPDLHAFILKRYSISKTKPSLNNSATSNSHIEPDNSSENTKNPFSETPSSNTFSNIALKSPTDPSTNFPSETNISLSIPQQNIQKQLLNNLNSENKTSEPTNSEAKLENYITNNINTPEEISSTTEPIDNLSNRKTSKVHLRSLPIRLRPVATEATAIINPPPRRETDSASIITVGSAKSFSIKDFFTKQSLSSNDDTSVESKLRKLINNN